MLTAGRAQSACVTPVLERPSVVNERSLQGQVAGHRLIRAKYGRRQFCGQSLYRVGSVSHQLPQLEAYLVSRVTAYMSQSETQPIFMRPCLHSRVLIASPSTTWLSLAMTCGWIICSA